MIFDPTLWGTYGQLISAIGSTAAFTAAFYVIRRDAKIRRIAQARQVVFYFKYFIDGEPMADRNFYIRNNSNESLYDVFFYEHGGRKISVGAKAVLHPAEETMCRSSTTPHIAFRDGAQVHWIKDLNGALRSGQPKYSKGTRTHLKRLDHDSRL